MIVYDKEVLAHRQYWLSQFQSEPTFPMVPTDFTSSEAVVARKDLQLSIDSEVTDQLMRVCKHSDVLIYTFLLAVSKIWLHKYTNAEKVGIGVPSYNPTSKLVPVVSRLEPKQSAKELIVEVKKNLTEVYLHQAFPLHHLFDELGVIDLAEHPPWTRLVVSLDSIHDPAFVESQVADLTIMFAKDQERLQARVVYNPTLYAEASLKIYFTHFVQILRSILSNSAVSITNISLVVDSEKQALLSRLKGETVAYPNKTIHELFEEQVQRTPDQVALVFGKESLTYQELNERANQLAHTLKAQGLRSEQLVAIMLDRSLDMIVGILGTLKAGGAYVPIDPEYPNERIHYILADSRAEILLTQQSLQHQVNFAGKLFCLDDAEIYDKTLTNIKTNTTPSHLAYVIYTSGTTGKPKGVMVEHRGMANLKVFTEQVLGITSEDRIIQFASLTFDASILEIGMALFTGAKLILVSKDTIYDHRKFEQYLNDWEVTVAVLTPSYATHLQPARLQSLALLITGGAEATQYLYKKWCNRVQYINVYGPSEATVFVTAWIAPKQTSVWNRTIPIGTAIPNMGIYIMDSQKQVQPTGVVGELCLSGVGLARGYLNRPELTAEKFIDHPYLPGEKLYKTGDLARWLPDGNIEFVGRSDHQVKIRGFRIELGEIESELLQHNQIKEALVLAKDDGQAEKYLCAYIVSEEDLVVSSLREFLGQRLPAYMLPSYFIPIEAMPLTSNGKVNHQALPEPESMLSQLHNTEPYCAPQDQLEKEMVELWEEVLQISPISIYDNFFTIGGHSLNALILSEKISEHFDYNARPALLFKNPTVSTLCKILRSQVEASEGNLILLNQGEDSIPPLFIVHGQGGGILHFVHFAQEFGSARSVYAFQAEGYDQGHIPELTVEQIAERYVAAMLLEVPTGPYYLSGWSFGGLVAFEMVKQLEDLGKEVAYLAVFDIAPLAEEERLIPNPEYRHLDPLVRFAIQLGEDGERFVRLSEEEQLQECRDLLRHEMVDEEGVDEELALSKMRLYAVNGLAFRQYLPLGRIYTDIHLFISLDESFVRNGDRTEEEIVHLWSPLTNGQVQLSFSAGDHYSMFETPNVKQLVHDIRNQLEREIEIKREVQER